ncbi:MAG: PDZ domain-containing protein [Planctomycetota bacterium]
MRKIITLSFILCLAGIACNSRVSNIDWAKVNGNEMAKAMGDTFVNAAEQIKPCVLYAEIYRSGAERYNKTSPSNAFVFKPEGYLILPDYYDPKDIDRIKVWVDETEYAAKFIDADKECAITVIKIQTEAPLKPLAIGDAGKILPGQYLIGMRAYGENMYFEKIGAARMVLAKIEEKKDRILTSPARSNDDNQKEIVTNLAGELIGTTGYGGVVAFNRLKQTAERLIVHADQQDKPIDIQENQPWEGYGCAELTKEMAEAWSYRPEGVLVRSVSKISPAGQAGLAKGDIIIAVDGQPITKKTKRGLVQFTKLAIPEIGRTIKITVLRDTATTATAAKETKDITFKLDKAPKPKEFTADDIGIQVKGMAPGEYADHALAINNGVMVTDIIGGSSAATSSSFGESLIDNNDVIIELYGITVNNLEDFIKAVDKVRAEKPEAILVKIQRRNMSTHVCLNLKIGKRTETKEEQPK